MCFTSDRKLRPCIYVVALAGAFIFWTLEAVMENGFITEHLSLAAFFPADPGVLWFRILIGFGIVAFSISYQERFSDIKELEQQLDSLRGDDGESRRTYISLCSSCLETEQHNVIDSQGTAGGNRKLPALGRREEVGVSV